MTPAIFVALLAWWFAFMSVWRHSLAILLLLGLLLLVWSGAAADTADSARPSQPTVPSYEREIAPLIQKYCLRCHSLEKKRGGIVLDQEKTDADILNKRSLWERVGDNLRTGEMPPPGSAKPNAAEMEQIERWLSGVVFKDACTGPRDPGRVTLRRLNRAEYNNTIRDLVGVDFQPAKDFPADDVGYGFDNIGDVLSLPPLLMEKYLEAADQIIEKAWARPSLRQKLLPTPPKEKGAAAKNLRHFASRAWRRPATDDEVNRLLNLMRAARDAGDPPDVGMRLALKAILASPSFLFRVEADPKETGPISQWELASRLSYFLWSSMPDEELFQLAQQGKLRDPAVLEAQVKRLLQDPKSVALADNFALQWLNVRGLSSFSPDPRRFPGVNRGLLEDMIEETRRFFLHVKESDSSILDFLGGEYTFINENLARHYGLKGVSGKEFRKVSLEGTPRAGVLTHASVLSVTSNPTRTSPVKRGKWILENILGTPPPPAPPDVPELEQQGELRGSLRQQMEQHRKDPSCASCHARMDPLGFGYENFDAVGRWRTRDGRHPIDASGELPDGSKFNGPRELKSILLARKELFAKCFTEKLLTYALGRGTERSDRCFIEEIAKKAAASDYRFSVVVLEIVRSDPFQKRRAKGPSR